MEKLLADYAAVVRQNGRVAGMDSLSAYHEEEDDPEKEEKLRAELLGLTAAYPKFESTPRLFRECIITEKLDGTNALVQVGEDGSVRAGSRTRWLTPGKTSDNFGFAAWVEENKDELRKLGVGRHYGEWWGKGIQRGYGLEERRFSLFNVSRWNFNLALGAIRPDLPACCHVVPVLGYLDTFSTADVTAALAYLKTWGSVAASGFMNPEGIVVFHAKSGHLYKVTLDGNDGHKGSL